MRSTKFSVALIVSVIIFATTKTFGQFSAGLDLGLPMGNFSDIATTGFGVSARYEAPIQEKLNWTASAGFLSYGGKSFLGGTFGNTTNVPLLGGIKYYFIESNSGIYASADLGLNFISYSVAFPNQGNGQGVTFGSASTTKFGFAPGIGYRISNWDFSGRVNLVSDFNYLNIRAAYVFNKK